ncbi:two-component system sensor histidine kinase NtrB [Desulfogranum mediterraneum]|uniref:two-component system sensor histidine kinase NtrB n=1 Tax=Desulfogranum mediterraneum TaxID=160661 RepID=UPI0004075E01|nr:ATP-binding protein [Desulfogranum mediterraneum]
MNSLPLLPANIVDIIGSSLAILLSFLALYYARILVRTEPNNFIWGFLFYFCVAMAAFSLSRGVGHIVRIFLVFGGQGALWKELSPYSGGFNTMLIISTAAVTIYYHKGLAAYKAIRSEAEKLSEANSKLFSSAAQLKLLNTHLEEIVDERTRNLSTSEKKFRKFFENSKDIIFFCDQSGYLTSINSSGRELLDLDPSLERVSFYDLFARAEDRQRYVDALQKNGFVRDLEIECRGRGGTRRYILFTANTVYDQAGTMVGCEGIGKDMTRLKTMTKQLINREKMASVGEMAAGVAHEINTPLGIILGYTQLMLDDYHQGTDAHANLEVMERQTKACRRIVADLLKFSRQADSVKAAIDLNQLIEEVLAVTEHSLNIHQVRVIRNFDPHHPEVIGDAEKLRQVMINLLNNAQYAMAEDGGRLFITTYSQQEEVLLSVRDTGSGIPEEIKSKIFDPFFTTKEVGKGTGLGLSVIYGIIQEHGGSITVESPFIDPESGETISGTAFQIRLPLSEAPKQTDREHT